MYCHHHHSSLAESGGVTGFSKYIKNETSAKEVSQGIWWPASRLPCLIKGTSSRISIKERARKTRNHRQTFHVVIALLFSNDISTFLLKQADLNDRFFGDCRYRVGLLPYLIRI